MRASDGVATGEEQPNMSSRDLPFSMACNNSQSAIHDDEYQQSSALRWANYNHKQSSPYASEHLSDQLVKFGDGLNNLSDHLDI